MKFTYCWFHIPSGTTGEAEEWFLSRHIMLEELNRWNATQVGIYQYWEKPWVGSENVKAQREDA